MISCALNAQGLGFSKDNVFDLNSPGIENRLTTTYVFPSIPTHPAEAP